MTSLEAAQQQAKKSGGCANAMTATAEARVFGGPKKAPSWKDTNLALFGSSLEKKIKEAAAGGEKAWDGVGQEKGILVWRIEQFRVVPWPLANYGDFHMGDSYIVLHTFQPHPSNPSLAFDIHFWIGNESTQDEYGTAAYKTTELGDRLGHGKARHHREVQGRESRKFLKLFGYKIKYLQGGVESGFRKVDHSREAVLLRVKGRGSRNVVLTQVECRRSAMNSGDVFILDATEGVFVWVGREANAWERRQACEVAQEMRQRAGGNREQMGTGPFTEVTVIEEDTPRADPPAFALHLPVETNQLGGLSRGVQAAEVEPDADVKGLPISLFQLSLDRTRSGEIGILPLLSGKLSRDALQTHGVYLVDTGFVAMLWVGKAAPFEYRITAFNFAQAYLKQFGRPAVMPLTREAEGSETAKFWGLFEPPEGYRIDVKKDPARFHPAMRAQTGKKGKKKAQSAPPAEALWVEADAHKNPSAIARTQSAADARAAAAEKEFGPGGGKADKPAPVPVLMMAEETAPLKGAGGEGGAPTEAGDSDSEDEDPTPRWEEVPRKEKLTCHDGVCYPVVSDAWGCCLTSCGFARKDMVNCLGMDIKGLYLMCGQVECLFCKPSFDKDHPNVYCVLGQGYSYGVVPECLLCPTERQVELGRKAYCRLCKGSQQAFCIQNRCSLPCDDEVPTTCTCLGHQCCREFRKTGDLTNRKRYNYELVPFLPYPEVRIMDESAIKRGGDADDFDLHWLLKSCLTLTGDLVNCEKYRMLNACCGFVQSVGCDFPTCIGANVIGSCLCCLEINCVLCKPVEGHKRVQVMCCQGGAYVAEPRKGGCGGRSICKGTAGCCCLEHRYSYPPGEGVDGLTWPIYCTLCGGQCCQFGQEGPDSSCQHECNRRCLAPIERLPRVKPAVAEASNVLYHETRKPLKNQLADLTAASGGGSPQGAVEEQIMQRV